jgi:transcriptional regulator with XRE-family HTH domain
MELAPVTNIRNLNPSMSPLDYYGSELRRLREAARLSQKQLGEILSYTGSLIGQIETARKCPTPEFTERADAALGAGGSLIRLLDLVLKSALPPWFQAYADAESNATHIYTYQAQLVHGLLQTEAYARAVLGVLRQESLDDRVTARLARQKILRRENPPLMWAVLDEAVLYRPMGGPEVMRHQLAHLLASRDQEWVNLQILPFAAGAHAGLPGSFNVLRLPNEPDIAYTEDYETSHATVNPPDVKARSLRYDHLQAAALSVEDSAELIAQVMEERYAEQQP